MNPLYFPLFLLFAVVALAVGVWVRHVFEASRPEASRVPPHSLPPGKAAEPLKPAPKPLPPPPAKPASPPASKPAPPQAPTHSPAYSGYASSSSSSGDLLGLLLGGLFLAVLLGGSSPKNESPPTPHPPPPRPPRSRTCSCPNCINDSDDPCTGCGCDKDDYGRCY